MSLTQTALALLTENGPMGSEEFFEALDERQPDWTDEELDAASDSGVLPIYDEFWVLSSWASNRIFTHRLSQAEIEADMIPMMPDWHVPNMLTSLGSDTMTLTDGTQVQIDGPWRDDADAEVPPELSHHEILIIFPRGYLAGMGLAGGTLVGLSLHATHDFDQARWHFEAVGTIADPPVDLEVSLSKIADDNVPVFNMDFLWDLLWRTDAFVEPVAPWQELIAAAGLTEQNDRLARGGFDFAAYDREKRAGQIARRRGISRSHAASVADVVGAAEYSSLMPLAGGGSATQYTDASSILMHLADPAVAGAVGSELRDSRLASPGGVLAALDALGSPPRRSRAAVLTLRALATERTGEALSAERMLHEALSADPDWPHALLELARFESDRGNAQRSLDLFTRAGAREHPLAEIVAGFVGDAVQQVGRNQPCPCGSGKKYKQCHLGRSSYPLPERAFWLSRKAFAYADTMGSHLLMRLFMCRLDAGQPAEQALGDATAFDIALFEGGLFERFLADRGVLLPADELALGREWLGYPRALHEVVSTRPGKGLRVRNVATGEEVDVVERSASKTLKTGMYFASRVVPVGDGQWNIYGGVEPVSLPMRQAVMAMLEDPEAGPLEVCTVLSSRFAPPTIVSSDGESLTVCSGLVDPGGDIELLDAVLEPNDDGWLDLDGDTIRAWVRIEGANLRVEAMTTTRFAQVVALIMSALPNARVLEQSQEPIAAHLGSALTGVQTDPTPMSAEEREVMAQVMRKMEDRWVDESIPALEGYTPRQAAEDPTRRGDLIRLLDSFPATQNEGQMDPDRLRALLDL